MLKPAVQVHCSRKNDYECQGGGSHGSRLLPLGEPARCVACGRLPCRMQALKKGHEGRRLWRTQILAISRHVATALNHLPNQLVLREAHRYAIQRRSSLSSGARQGMAVAALLALKNQCAPPLE